MTVFMRQVNRSY